MLEKLKSGIENASMYCSIESDLNHYRSERLFQRGSVKNDMRTFPFLQQWAKNGKIVP